MSRTKLLLRLSFSIALLAASVPATQAQGAGPGAMPSQAIAAESKAARQRVLTQRLQRLQDRLGARGYEVALGETKLFTIDDCDNTVATIGNCMAPNPAAPYVMPVVPPWSDEYVDPQLANLLGPLPRDTRGNYQISPTVDLEDGKVVAVVGTLGTTTGNATYVGMSVNWMEILKGVTNVSDDVLEGSAASFSAAVANTDKLYLHYYARDCSGLAHCQEVTQDMVPAGGLIKIIQRNYVAPGTARGPDPQNLVNPVAIVLDGTSRPSDR